jgi:hypothetical protein
MGNLKMVSELEHAAATLVMCMHPHKSRVIPNRATPGSLALCVLCELCGSTSWDDGRTWKAPESIKALNDALSAGRAKTVESTNNALLWKMVKGVIDAAKIASVHGNFGESNEALILAVEKLADVSERQGAEIAELRRRLET